MSRDISRGDRVLANAFRTGMQLRAEMRQSGASESDCAKALERVIRANWPIVPESEWPYWARVPRCIKCDGYGWQRETVTDRLGQVVDVVEPCTCEKGRRYVAQQQAADFTQAGKTEKPKKGFQRWGG